MLAPDALLFLLFAWGPAPDAGDSAAPAAEEETKPVAEQPADSEPAAETEAEEPTGDEDGPGTQEGGDADTATSATDEAGAVEEGPEGEGELDMADIFGTQEEHTDVEVVNEPPPSRSTRAPGRLLPGNLETRWRIVTSAYLDVDRTEDVGFGRNENRLEFYFAYTPNDHIQIVGDIEPVFMGVSQARELNDLATRSMLTPFHVESDAAYVALIDLLPGLDIKVGRQILVWGTADKFNPTNNINADDLEDRPLFTEPIANQMVVADLAPWGDKLWFQGVYVPLFFPALLPPSAAAALKDPQAPVPYAHDLELRNIGSLQGTLAANDTLVPEVRAHVVMPKLRFRNSQAAAKVGWHFWEIDMSLSYYYGRHDIPTPVNVESTQIRSNDPALVPPEDLYKECCFVSDLYMVYPRMQVVGLDFAAGLPFLGDLGVWGEAALFFPEAHELRIEFPIPVSIEQEDGTSSLQMEMSGPTIRKTPFVKATAGLDYTFGKHVYVQAQYLRGFIDEFGTDHIGNYLVGGTDLIFFGRHLIFRFFAVGDFPTGKKDVDGDKDKGSLVLYPNIIAVPPWGFLTFELGGFFLLGDDRTKFGQAAAGSSVAFLKATGAF